jgi:hypothetical protein
LDPLSVMLSDMPHDAFECPPLPLSAVDSSSGRSEIKSQELHKLHRQFKPAGSKRQQLTPEDAVEIFAMRPKDKGTRLTKRGSMLKCKIIGPKYGVSPKTIRDIWRGRTWKDATKTQWTLEDTVHTRKYPSKPKSPAHARDAYTESPMPPTKAETVAASAPRSTGGMSDGLRAYPYPESPAWPRREPCPDAPAAPTGHQLDPAWRHRGLPPHRIGEQAMTRSSSIDHAPSALIRAPIDPRRHAAPQPSPTLPPRPRHPPSLLLPLGPPPGQSPLPPPPGQQRLPPAVAALLLSALLRSAKPLPPLWPAAPTPSPAPPPPACHAWGPPLSALAALVAAAGAPAPPPWGALLRPWGRAVHTTANFSTYVSSVFYVNPTWCMNKLQA